MKIKTVFSQDFIRILLHGGLTEMGEAHLEVKVQSVIENAVHLVFNICSEDGVVLSEIADVRAREGTSISLTKLKRAFEVRLA